jgi:hypothetical protein
MAGALSGATTITASGVIKTTSAGADSQFHAINTLNTGYAQLYGMNDASTFISMFCAGSNFATAAARNVATLYAQGASLSSMLISVSGIDKPLIFQINSVEVGRFTGSAGQLSLPVTGSGAGILYGGDVQRYRGAANVDYLASGDSEYIVAGGLGVGTAAAQTTSGVIDAGVGFRIANAAALGHTLQGDGTNFVSKEPDFLLQQVFN